MLDSVYHMPLKVDFIACKMNIISGRKHIVDTDVANAVTYTRRNVFKRVAIQILMT